MAKKKAKKMKRKPKKRAARKARGRSGKTAKRKAARKTAKRKSAKKKRASKKKRKPAKRKVAKKKAARKRPAKRKVAKKKPARKRPAKRKATAPKRAAAREAEPTPARVAPAPERAPMPVVVPPAAPEPSAPAPAPAPAPRAGAVPSPAPAVRSARLPSPFLVQVTPDWGGFIACVRRQGTPARVHFIELFLDREVQDELCKRYGILDRLDPGDEFFTQRRAIAIQRFLGYDYVVCGLEGLEMPKHHVTADDTAALARAGGRNFIDEHRGPITTMEEYERYPWPDPEKLTSRALEWYEKNLPDDMCVIGGLCGHFAENLSWLMGYETLCYALYEARDLVSAIARRTLQIDREIVKRLCQFDRVKAIWGSDDMGHRSGTLIGPEDMREFVLPGHRILASFAHMHGRPYILHSCGNLSDIMEDLIGNVRIDGKHSFEDTIEDVRDAKRKYGDRIALLGGIDVDFLCRADEDAIGMRVRSTLSTCHAGGGYLLGTGNSVANYIPVDNYLAMLDAGRKFGR